MKNETAIQVFTDEVVHKYKVYNSLFMNLPFDKVQNTGAMIPLLLATCKRGFDKGKNPNQIIQYFFEKYTDFDSEEQQISFLFRVIQYVERQVVLFDSLEDASYGKIAHLSGNIGIEDQFKIASVRDAADSFLEKLNKFKIRYVFTAHPTQFYPPAVQMIIQDLRQAVKNDDIKQINELLSQLGRTSFLNNEKPTVLQEAQSIIYYLRHVYFDTISLIHQRIAGLYSHQNFDNHNIVGLGFWPGGDRDGNPFVRANITQSVADELRMTLMKCYYNHLKQLRRRMSFRGVEEPLKALSDTLYRAMFSKDFCPSYDDIIKPLKEAKDLLISKYDSLFLADLEDMIARVQIFKCHFATLDIRQDSRKHHQAFEEIMQKYGIIDVPLDALTFEERVALCLNPDVDALAADFSDEIVQDTIENIRNLKNIQQKNGEEGCNRYIISNSEDVFSVLHVYGLFKACGWRDTEITFDIIPLFETMRGMENAQSVMDYLYSHPIYEQHLKQRGMRQTIMLGFSDGTKDGGYLKANWEILKTKERLTEVSRNHDVQVLFFDGRGGPPARGGGMTHKFYAAQGDRVANDEIQLTIQGQTISSMYGNMDQFQHNCDQLLAAGMSSYIQPMGDIDRYRPLMDELAERSYQAYIELKQHPKFIAYLEKISTLKYYGRAKIGSRPGKRGNKKELTLDDLRAISFVGSWSQLKQNVPGYYGIGTAIQSMKDEGRIDEVKELFDRHPFFKSLILNSMMSMTKTFFPLTAYLKNDDEFGAFWNLLFEEFKLSKAMVLEISGYDQLMQGEPVSKASIALREEIVLPLLTIQQYALQKTHEGGHHVGTYEKLVTRSLFGNINASRNSA